MADVFISYSRKDKDFVRQLHDALAKLNREAWVDWHDIPLTAEWLEEIYAGIDSADNFLFVISPESIASIACHKEIAHASESNKRLIPLLHREVPDADIPETLAQINFVYFREADDFDATLASLVDALDTDLDWKRTHTRLLVRAKEWEQKGHDKSFLLRGEDLREAEKWQAEAATKHPKPSPLHSQYILASRQGETRRQRITLGGAVAALVVTFALAVAAVIQRNTARQETSIALAGQLSAQAELARATSPEASALLSVESEGFAQVPENTPVLQRTLPLLRKAVAVLMHGDAVDAVAFSPDGRLLATGSQDRTARVFAVPSGKELARYEHGEMVTSVAFSPDGRYLATASWDGAARVFEWATGKQVVLKHQGRVDTVAFSPDGRYLATASWDKSARVFEAPDWKQVARVEHKEIVVHVAWDPSSRYLVSAGFDGRAQVFEAANGHVLQSLPHQGAVQAVAFSPDSRYVATGSWDKSARVFEVSTGKLVTRMQLQKEVETVAFSPHGHFLCVGASDNTARIYESVTGKELIRLQHQLRVNSVAWSPDGRYGASASADRTALIFDAASGNVLARIEHPEGEGGVAAVAFSPDGQYVATGSFDGTARISPLLASVGKVTRMENMGKVLSQALSPHGEYLATGTWDDTVTVSDVTMGSRLAEMKLDGAIYGISFSWDAQYVAASADGIPGMVQIAEVHGGKPAMTLHPQGTRGVAFSPDGHHIAAENERNVVQLFAFPGGAAGTRFEHEAKPDELDEIHAMAFSPDGQYLVTSRSDQMVRVFNAATAKVTASLHQGTPLSMAFSPDGHYVVARLSQNFGLVFRASDGKVVNRLEQAGGVLAVAFSPDGRYVATGGGDHAAIVFDAFRGNPVARIDCSSSVRAVQFSADGKYLITAAFEQSSDDITVVVQQDLWKHEDLKEQACSRLNRNFTATEWQQYFPGQAYRRTCLNLPSSLSQQGSDAGPGG